MSRYLNYSSTVHWIRLGTNRSTTTTTRDQLCQSKLIIAICSFYPGNFSSSVHNIKRDTRSQHPITARLRCDYCRNASSLTEIRSVRGFSWYDLDFLRNPWNPLSTAISKTQGRNLFVKLIKYLFVLFIISKINWEKLLCKEKYIHNFFIIPDIFLIF